VRVLIVLGDELAPGNSVILLTPADEPVAA
jgi:hypothetical protein